MFFILLFISSCITKEGKLVVKDIPKDKKQSIKTKKFGAWVFHKEGKSCYIYSFPVSSYGFYLERKIHFIEVNDKKEVSIVGGINYKKNSKVKIDISTFNFFLETEEGIAWTDHDELIIKTFLDHKDNIFFVYNEFQPLNYKDQSAVDKYTLQGFLDAWEYMTIKCNVEPLVVKGINKYKI